jgi:sigma-B regulation protein RsbU (phosphoserine phosphatase)
MDQKKLHRMIEAIASRKFDSETEMLITVLNEIIENENLNVTGGRIWKLLPEEQSYKLLYQNGRVEQINTDFKVKIEEYPQFAKLAKERTVFGSETNKILLRKGIFKYSASGVGDKIKLNGTPYYEYLLALNTDVLNEGFALTLSIIATALTSQIKQKRISSREVRLRADIDKGREIQKSILPEHEYRFHNFELFGVTQPAEIVGGDFFDYLDIGDDKDRIGVTVGDAASKGVGAAAEAMYISGALRMASNFEIKISPLMKRMNQLVNKIFSDDKFASLFYGELSTDPGGLFLYANAGHNPPYFARRDNDDIELLNSTGPVLGPAPGAKYTIDHINFRKGDVLLIYSDGVIDSTDEKFNAYGEERLLELFKKSKHLSSKEIVYTILEDLMKFTKIGKYQDDKTLVVIKRIK